MNSTCRLATLLFLAASGAWAQSPEQFLPREPDTRPDPARQVAPPEEPGAPGPVAAPAQGGQFILRRMVLDGATALTPAELEPIWADLVGQAVSLDTKENGIYADVVAGVSIGAFNAAIVASHPRRAAAALEAFWRELAICTPAAPNEEARQGPLVLVCIGLRCPQVLPPSLADTHAKRTGMVTLLDELL